MVESRDAESGLGKEPVTREAVLPKPRISGSRQDRSSLFPHCRFQRLALVRKPRARALPIDLPAALVARALFDVAAHPPESVARIKRMLHRWDDVEERTRDEGRGQIEWQRSGPGLPYER